MLARRMLTFVAVLLALTALAAAFAPPPPRNLGSIGSLNAEPAPVDQSVLIETKLDADTTEKTTITLEQGDELHLEVTGSELDAVELRGLAQIRALAPDALVTFDVIAEEPGTYPVVLTMSNRTIAEIEVIPPRREGLAPAEPLTHRTRDT